MTYIEHLLPFSISLKRKELLILCNGEIKGMGNIFHLYHWKLILHPWTWNIFAFCIFTSNSWVFILSASWSTLMIHLTPLSQFSYVLWTWEMRGSFPEKGPSSFDFMSPMKENSFVVSCLESLKWLRGLQGGIFHKFSPQGHKKYKIMPRRTLPVMIG